MRPFQDYFKDGGCSRAADVMSCADKALAATPAEDRRTPAVQANCAGRVEYFSNTRIYYTLL